MKERRRMKHGSRKQTCSRCKVNPIRSENQRLCKECHAEDMKLSRIAQKINSNAKSHE